MSHNVHGTYADLLIRYCYNMFKVVVFEQSCSYEEGKILLPIERQKRILELIQDKQSMKISELSNILSVSEMTIHRDLKPLIKQKNIIKTFGGITLVHTQETKEPNKSCILCGREVHERMAYRLISPDNKVEIACCAHCGLLRHKQLGDLVIQTICYDFFRQTTINATLGWYVMDTTIDIGCCQPQVLTFEWKEHANKFVEGFGGNVYSFNKAMEMVLYKMNDNSHQNT